MAAPRAIFALFLHDEQAPLTRAEMSRLCEPELVAPGAAWASDSWVKRDFIAFLICHLKRLKLRKQDKHQQAMAGIKFVWV